MKLRRNEYCPIHRSLRCCGREPTHHARTLQPGFDVLMIHTIRGTSGTQVHCRNPETAEAEGRRNRTAYAQSATMSYGLQRHRARP